MKRMLLVSAMLMAMPAFAEQYLVKYKDVKTYNHVTSFSFSANKVGDMLVLGHHDAGKYIKVDIASNKKVQVLAQLLSQPGVQYVVPNFKLHAYTTPFDAKALKDQWSMSKINAEKAWTKAGNKGSKNVLVAVIDTGVDYKHTNLAPNMVPGYNFKDNNNDPMDKTSAQNPGHGTHCSGVIGATGLVDGGIVGMSPGFLPLEILR